MKIWITTSAFHALVSFSGMQDRSVEKLTIPFAIPKVKQLGNYIFRFCGASGFFATGCFASFFPCTCCCAFNVIVICLTKCLNNSPCLCIYSSYLSYSSYFSLLIAFWRQLYLIMFLVFCLEFCNSFKRA